MGQAHRRIVLASDLHLGCRHLDEDDDLVAGSVHERDVALGRWLEALVVQHHHFELTLLGDTFALTEVRAAPEHRGTADSPMREASEALECVLSSHPIMVRALAELARSSIVRFVAGDHDVELSAAALQRRVRAQMERASRTHTWKNVVFEPWIYFVPGLLYAEHGNQYHPINAFPALLWAFMDGDVDRSWLARFDRPVSTDLPRLLWRQMRQMARAQSSHERRIRYRQSVLQGYAERIGLEARAVLAIDEHSQASPSVAAIARQAARRLAGGASHQHRRSAGYLHDAWPHVHSALQSVGQSVPFYVFGHTHVPERRSLADGVSYLNPGAWAERVVSYQPRSVRGAYVLVEQSSGGSASAALRRWPEAG